MWAAMGDLAQLRLFSRLSAERLAGMTAISTDALSGDHAQPARPRTFIESRTCAGLIVLAAFWLYWGSAVILESRAGTTHFGADAHLYSLLAQGFAHDRVARFHPLTTTMAAAWLKMLSPLTVWFHPQTLLKAMFAAVGALGVSAAMAAFAAVVPRRYVAQLGIIYATSLSIWYFSSIEESKIVSATLAALYIAAYLRLRRSWSTQDAALLTAILLLACLNEIVAGFLVVIPAVDTLVQRGWRLSGNWWIGWHALAAPLALVFLEVFVNGRLVAANPDPEGASHISMLLYYVTQNQYSLAAFGEFMTRWFLYSIATPSLYAMHGARPEYSGDYGAEVSLVGYFSTPVSGALAALLVAILAASLLPRYRRAGPGELAGLSLALLAYAVLRATFFFLVYPAECLIFSSSTVLAHMLLVGMPFAASFLPWKRSLLAAFAALLFVTNASFIIGY